MKITNDLRLFLNEVAEQLKIDAEIIEMHMQLIKKDQPHTIKFFEAVKEACEGKWRRALEFLD